jgi:arylsulfatase A-like enzyme
MLRLDATLENLISFIDATVGLQKTLIVLSSDHGVSAIPEYMHSLGFSAGRHSAKALIAKVDAALQRRYNSDTNFVLGFWNPSVYLNLKTVEQLSLDIGEVEQALREEILNIGDIALAVTRTELLRGKVTNIPLMNMIQRAFHPKRSGNLLIVQQPFWFLYPGKTGYAAMHGSPYTYDTYVPIMVTGPRISPQWVHRSVGPEDIAPTIANYLGIKPPSGSVGEVLTEVVEQRIDE